VLDLFGGAECPVGGFVIPRRGHREQYCLLDGRSKWCVDFVWRMRILDAGDVEEGGGEELAEEDAKNDDRGMEEFVGHVRRVKGNALTVLLAVQIILKISSNVSGEKIKPRLGAGRDMLRGRKETRIL
jgi:hypothetical protein